MATLYVNSSWSSTTVTIGGNSYTVDAVGSIAFSTISNAVEAAQDGDTINVYALSTASIAANLKPDGTFSISNNEAPINAPINIDGKTLTVYAKRLETKDYDSQRRTLYFSGPGHLTLLLRDQFKVNPTDQNKRTDVTISGGLHLTVTKDVANKLTAYFPMTYGRETTFSVIEGSVFEVTQQFKSQEGATVEVSGSTFSAGHYKVVNNNTTTNFTNAQVTISGGTFLTENASSTSSSYLPYNSLNNAGTVNILYGTKFVADTAMEEANKSEGINNTGTINVKQSDFSANELDNRGTITVTGGVASLTLTGLTSADNGKLITVTDGDGATVSEGYVTNIDDSGEMVFVGLNGEGTPAFTAGTTYYVTIAGRDASAQYGSSNAFDVTAATLTPKFEVAATVTNQKTLTVSNADFSAGTLVNAGTASTVTATFNSSKLTIGGFTNSKTVRINTSDTTIQGDLKNTTGTFTVTTPGYLAVVLDEDLSGATVTVKKGSNTWTFNNVNGASGSTVYLYGASASTKPSAPYDFLKGDTYSVRINSGTWSNTVADVPFNKFEVNGTVTVSGGTLAVTNIDFKAGTTVGTTFTGSSVSNAGTITVTNSTFDSGAIENTGTITVTASTVHTGAVTNGGTLTVTNSTFDSAGAVTNGGTLTVTASTVHTGAVTNTGTLTVDAASHLTASSITINSTGTLKFFYDKTNLDCISTDTNKIINDGGGTITIDVSKFYQEYAQDRHAKYAADFLVEVGQTIVLVDGNNTVTDITATIVNVVDGYGQIQIGPKHEPPDILFVNAAWTNTMPGSVRYKGADYLLNNIASEDAYVNAFCSLQAAIDAAKVYNKNCTIVFYQPSSGSSSLDFLSQGAITVDTSVIFDTNTTTEAIAVKIDSLHIDSEVTAEFRNGYYSMEDFIDNDGTMKISDHARFNANMIGNDGHKSRIIVDSTSRLTADANEEGDIQIEIIGGADHKINGRDPWILRPVGSITDDPEVDIIVPIPDSTATKTFIDVRSGDKLVRDSEGKYYIYRGGNYYSVLPAEGDPTEGAPSGTLTVWDCTDQYKGLYLVSDVFDLRKTGNDENDPYWSNAIYVDAGFTNSTTENGFDTDGGKHVKATYATGSETSMPEPSASTGVYAFSSFVAAYNSKYTANHKIGTTNQGMVIRLRGGSSVATVYDETETLLNKSVQNDVIVEPDKTDGEHYDKVSLILSGMTSGNLAHLMEFSNLDSLTIGGTVAPTAAVDNNMNWSVGCGSADGNRESSLLTFVNIGTLTINSTLKAQHSASIRIINCANVVSNKHLSIVGGTLIIDSSNITLAGAYSDYGTFKEKYGVLSTENNDKGTGNLIVRNSTFRVKGTGSQTVAQGLYVNLKGGSEFMIEGMSTVSGVFTNANDDSPTTITFSNAMMDENTNIQGYGNKGASLKFEGYNVLDGSYVAQEGNRNMTIESGATLNMSDGATISVGGSVNVQNCGSISLNDSTITAGSFDNTGSLTLSDGATIDLGSGTFTNQVNGTVTVDLLRDPVTGVGTIGITAGGIVNNGLILIDLSHTDYPDDTLRIDLTGLNNSKTGELRVIGGGGEVKEETGDTPQLYVQLAVPKMQTLYVNGEWDPAQDWKKGKNVGTYMYYGYNSFKDNPTSDSNPGADAFRSLTLADNTEKVVYYGGNNSAYGDLDLASAVTKITVGGVAYTRYSVGDTKLNTGTEESPEYVYYYAWKKDDDDNLIYTKTLEVVGGGESGTPTFEAADGSDPTGTVSAVAGLDALTLTTLNSSMTSKLTFDVPESFRGSDNKLTVQVKKKVSDDPEQWTVVEEKTITVPAGSGAYKTTIYSSKLDTTAGENDYKVVISKGTETSDLIQGTFAALPADRATATMRTLMVKGGQTVTLSGATMSLVGATDGADSTITNSGTVNVGTGESAKLELAVAKAKNYRDVKVRISSVGFEEYHTVSVAPNTDTIVVRSDSLIVGDYNVFVTDTLQCSYESNNLRVDVKNAEAPTPRRVKIVARNADGLKYIYGTNGQLMVPNGQSSIGLETPTFNNDFSITGDSHGFVVSYDGGKLKLKVPSESEVVLNEATIINVSGTGTASYDNGSVSPSSCNVQFEYSFRLDAGPYVADWESDPVDTALTDKGYYYVEVEEDKVVAKATEDSITGSAVKAENVTNSGSLTIASQKDFPDGDPSSKSAKLVLDVDRDTADRWVTVTEGEKTYSMYVAAGKSTADLASKDFTVGTNYNTVTIADTFTRTIKVEGNDGKLIVDGLIAGSVNGNSGRTLRISYKIGSTETTTVSPEVVIGEDGEVTLENMGTAGTEYIVTVEDTRTVSNVEAQTLVEFTAAAVTNEASAVITVDNSRFTVTGTLVNKDKTDEQGSTPGSITLSDSTFIAGTVTNNGTFTVDGTNELTIGTLEGNAIELLDGAVITDSSITTTGGALNVGTHTEGEEPNQATVGNRVTFTSTTGNSNSFANTAITNSGSITVEGTFIADTVTNTAEVATASIMVEAASFTAASVSTGDGTFTVAAGASASTLAITELTGTITVNTGAELTASSVSGTNGVIRIADDASVTVSVTNVFANVTNGNGGTIEVAAGGTLTAGTLDNTSATITVEDGATLKDSGITNGTITAEGNFTFAGANTLDSVAVNADNRDVTNTGTLLLKVTGEVPVSPIQFNVSGRSITNSGTITVYAVTNLIVADDIVNTSETNKIIVNASAYAGGDKVKVLDVADTATLTLADIQVEGISVTGAHLLQTLDRDIYVGVVEMSTVYVNSSWTEYEVGQEIADNAGKFFGINAFSSFVAALTVAQPRTDATTITVLSDITETSDVQYLFGSNQFMGDVTINGVAVVDQENPGGRNPLVSLGGSLTEFDPTPADTRTFAFSAGSVDDGTVGVDFTMTAGSFWPNEHPTDSTKAYFSIASAITAPVIVFKKGTTTVTGELATPNNGNVYILNEAADVTIDGDNAFTNSYQVTTGTLELVNGTLTTRDARISLQNLGFTDDWDRGANDEPEVYTFASDAVLNSENTVWDIAHDVMVRFYTVPTEIDPETKAILNFTNSVVNVSGNVINAPHKTTTGQDSVSYLEGSPAMTINLNSGSILSVANTLTNAGTIRVNASTVSAAAVDNDGTFTVEGESKLVIDTLAGNNAIQLLNGTRLNQSNITGGAINAVGAVTLSGSAFYSTTLTVSDYEDANDTNVTGALAFAGNNLLNGVTLTATGKAITNAGTITVTVSDTNPTITAGSISNNSGIINVSTVGLTLENEKYTIVDAALSGNYTLQVNGDDYSDGDAIGETGYRITTLGETGVYLVKADVSRETLYVGSQYTSGVVDGHVVGWNAFETTTAAQTVINSISTVTALTFTAQETPYDDLALTLDRDFTISQQPNPDTNVTVTTVTLGSLTITNTDATTHTVASGADLNVTGPWLLGANTSLTNSGKITVKASANAITAASIDNTANSAKITIDATAYISTSGLVTVIDVGDNTAGGLNLNDNIEVINLGVTDAHLLQAIDGDIRIGVVVKTDLFVNSSWTGYEIGQEITDNAGKYYGINAFSTAADVTGAITSDTASITFESGDTPYGNLDLSGDNVGNITLAVSGTGTAKIGELTTKSGQTVELTGAYSFDGAFVNNGTITTDSALTVNGTASGSKLGTISTSATLTVEDFTIGGGDSITVTGTGALTVKNATIDSGASITTAGDVSFDTVTINSVDNVSLNGTGAIGFAGDSSLDGVMLNVSGHSVENTGTLTVDGSQFTAGTITNSGTITVVVGSSISAASIAGGSIELTGVGSGTAVGTYQFVTTTGGITGTSFTCTIDAGTPAEQTVSFTVDGTTGTSHTADNKYWFTKTATGISLTVVSPAQTALYVNSAWTDVTDGTLVTYGDITLVKGTNAFSNLADALSAATPDTSAITLLSNSTASNSADRYIAFENSSVTIEGACAYTGEIGFATGNDLCLTPNAGGTLTIASHTTISTVGDKSSAYIVLNYGHNSGTVAVNGTLDSSTEIALWGTTTVGTTGRLVSNDDGIILFRSGYTGASAAVTVTGNGTYDENDAAQIDATWFFLASGAVSVTGSKVNAVKFKFDQNLDSGGGNYTADADAGTAAVLTSVHTEWTIGEIVANGSGITKNGEFNFENGSVVTVTGDAAFRDKIALNLTASDMTVGGDLANAGAITVTAGTKGTESNVGSMLSVTGEAANYAGSVVLDNDGAIAAGTTYGITVTNSQFDVVGALANTGAILVNSSSLITAASIDNANADGPRGIIVIDASDYEDARTAKAGTDYVFTLGDSPTETTTYVKVIDVAGNQGTTLSLDDVVLTGAASGICLLQLEDGDICVGKVDQSTLYVNSSWDDNTQAGKEVSDGEFYDYNAYSGLAAAIGKAKETDAEIVVEKLGTQSATGYVYDSSQPVIQLGDVKTTINSTDTTYQKAVYGGEKIEGTPSDATLAVVDDKEIYTKDETRSTEIEVSGGSFNKFIVGGNNINLANAGDSYTVTAKTVTVPDPTDATKEITVALPQTVEVTGGVFNGIVATGDRVQKGELTLNSDLEMNINGGKFTAYVAGGVMNALYEKSGETETTNGKADVYGNVSLNITSGEFTDSCWIYGGCISTSRSVSSYASTIYGDVTVTVDCGTGNTIQLSHLAAGSHGMGAIKVNETTSSGGNTAIVFKGDGSNLSFTANGELWGGSGRDNLNARTGICEDSFVEGDRLLSFEGFTGDLSCTRIRDFSSIQLIGESEVGITGSSVDLCGIENWTFEYDSSLSGNFGNNFENDTLTLDLSNLGVFSNGLSWTLLENSNSDAFTGFGNLFENVEAVAEAEECTVEAYCEAHRLIVQVKTETMTQWGWDSDNNCYSGTIGDYSGTLALDNTKTKMILTLA